MSVNSILLLSVVLYSASGAIELPANINSQNKSYKMEQSIYYSCGYTSQNNNVISRVADTYTEVEEFSMSIPLTRNLNKLEQITSLKLKDDGSITFSSDFTKMISEILISLKYQPEIFPNFRGNIQLEYEEDNGKYLEIEITPDMKMNLFKIDECGNEFESDDFYDIDMEKIKNEVNIFYE